jgi:hypothetical protein
MSYKCYQLILKMNVKDEPVIVQVQALCNLEFNGAV